MNLKKTSKPSNLFISVIIPVEKKTDYLLEALEHYSQQTYNKFELIIAASYKFTVDYPFVQVVTNKILAGDVASKRNEIIKYGKGEIFVFNDDDVFVPLNYLQTVVNMFVDREVIAACGPLLTPPNDNFRQQASGAVWESYLGSLGAGLYRSRKFPSRIVYDYPAANLIVRKDAFEKIGGFEPGIFPGEDTKFCLLMLNKYNMGVFYHPSLYVYHHRKSLFREHLQQIGKYGHQRGWFALSYPTTSFQLRYFTPAILIVYLFILPFLLSVSSYYKIPLLIYVGLVILEFAVITVRKGYKIGLTCALGIIATHLYYGANFIKSFFGKIISKI